MNYQEVNMNAAKTIREIANSAKLSFVGRNDAIDAIEACLLSGQHCVLLGKPGTAKSALIEYFAKSMGLGFYKTLFNPDLLRDDIYGPIDPDKFVKGIWDRKWTGLATKPIAFGDEVGKASGQVLNLLLTALEEREAYAGDTTVKLPLISFFGASNELFEGESQAIWDRFLARVHVTPSLNAADFQAMLTANVTHSYKPVDLAELQACNAQAKAMAASPSQEVITTLTELWTHFKTISESYVSDRRWRRTLLLAAGRALADGCTEIKPEHLYVARFTLWSEVSEIDTIAQWIDGIVDKAARELKEATVKLKDIDKAYRLLNGSADLGKRAEINMKLDKLSSEVRTKQGSEWAKLRTKVQDLKNEVLA
jgi:MoxR-like ATPase